MIAALIPISSAVDVEQRAAGVAGVDRGVGLDEVAVEAVPAASRSVDRRDDADGHRVRQAEWIADGDRGLADHEVVRRAEPRWPAEAPSQEILSTARSDSCEVPTISAQNSRLSCSVTRTREAAEMTCSVRQDVARGIDQDARAEAVLHALLAAPALEEVAEELRRADRWRRGS